MPASSPTDSPSASASTTPTLSAPEPLAPADGALVDGASVTLTWDAVPEASGYRVQAASDSGFDTLRLDLPVGPSRSVTVYETFPTNGRRFFWRVGALAGDAHGPFSAPTPFRTVTDDAVEQQRAAATRRQAPRRTPAPAAAAAAADPAAPHLTGVTSRGDVFAFLFMILTTLVLLIAISVLAPVSL